MTIHAAPHGGRLGGEDQRDTPLETNDQIRLGMAKGLLGEARIPFWAGRITLHKALPVQVAADRAAESRETLRLLETDVTQPIPGEAP